VMLFFIFSIGGGFGGTNGSFNAIFYSR